MKIYRINGEYRQTIPISDVLKMSARNFDEIPEVFFISLIPLYGEIIVSRLRDTMILMDY